MSDPTPQKRSLSEISHLFLSDVRDRQTGGFTRPSRKPPRLQENVSIDLTPEEFAQVMAPGTEADTLASDANSDAAGYQAPGMSAVLSAHLNGRQFDRVKEYARALAARVGRIGLIEIDSSEFRLMCFDPSEADWPSAETAGAVECFDPRQMSDALAETNCDVVHWLLLITNPRLPEARALLRDVSRWVVLSTCDHDGIVSSYRLLKGLSDIVPPDGGLRPTLSLALLDAGDTSETARVYEKLSGVCEQFLSWPLEQEARVTPAPRVMEHLMMFCRPTRDKAQLAIAPQWTVVGDFVSRVKREGSRVVPAPRTIETAEESVAISEAAAEAEAIAALDEPSQLIADLVVPTTAHSAPAPASVSPSAPATAAGVADAASSQRNDVAMNQTSNDPPVAFPRAADSSPAFAPEMPMTQIIDLNGAAATTDAVLSAVLAQADGAMIECPLRPPMCSGARLAISRQRELTLIAMARQGLAELRLIGQAFHWLNENAALIAMAMPQFSIDLTRPARLRLLIDHADSTAAMLQPLLQSDRVTVQACRQLRWGEKTGLLLEAA